MSSFHRSKIILVLFYFLLIYTADPDLVYAQDGNPDSLSQSEIISHGDTVNQTLWPSLVMSAIIPGLGQIRQENPGRAVIFYSTSLALLSNTITNFREYNDKGSRESQAAAYASLALLSQVYIVNILDVLDTYLRDKYEPWPQDLFSDIPLKSPWGAVARSAMLPGWGQVYNEQYIKGVIGIGAFAYFAGRIYHYNQEYQKTGNTEFRDKRVTNSWYLGLTYAVVMIDAYVDAYLFRFDDAMQLNLNLIPEENSFTINLEVSIVF